MEKEKTGIKKYEPKYKYREAEVEYHYAKTGKEELLELGFNSVLELGDQVYNMIFPLSVTFAAEPKKFDEVIKESCIIIPIKQLGVDELETIFDRLIFPNVEYSIKDEMTKRLNALILSGVFDKEKLCLVKTSNGIVSIYKIADKR
jgi:hypothetical protein